MRQPLVIMVLVFILGLIVGVYGGLPLWAGIIAAGITGSGAIFTCSLRRKYATHWVLLSIFSFGILWVTLNGLDRSYLEQNTGIYVDLVGTIVTEGKSYPQRETYVVEVQELILPEGRRIQESELLLFNLYRDPGINLGNAENLYPGLCFSYGDQLQIHGQLELPRVARNPGEFDYRTYLARQDITTQISVNAGEVQVLATHQGHCLKQYIFAIKESVKDFIQKVLPFQQGSLLLALLFGDQTGISDVEQEQYRRIGLIHIFSVSGFHVGFVLLFGLLISQLCRFPPVLRVGFTLGLILVFASFTGFQPPVLRASLMAVCALLARLIHRETDFVNSLALAAGILLLWNPQWLFDAGFQLSFLATWGIVYLAPRMEVRMQHWSRGKRIIRLIAVPLCAQIAIIPICAYYFNQVSLISLLSNIALTSLAGGVVILALFAFPFIFLYAPFAEFWLLTNGAMLQLLNQAVEFLAQIPGGAVVVAQPPLLLIFIFYLLLLLWGEDLFPQIWRQLRNYFFPLYLESNYIAVPIFHSLRFCILCLCIIGVSVGLFHRERSLKLVFLDVGQGDCIYVQTPSGKRVLVDGGGSPHYVPGGFEVGKEVVLPYLQRQGVQHLDLVINTHPDADHLQGLTAVLEGITVTEVLVNAERDAHSPAALENFLRTAEQQGSRVQVAHRGMGLNLDPEVRIDILHPGNWDHNRERAQNNHSIVLRIVYQNTSFLLTGDIENAGMEELFAEDIELASQVFKIPHHGSRYSLNHNFLEAVRPQAVVVSVGKNNFGHPADEVLNYWMQQAIPVFRTDQQGAITLESDGAELRITPFISANPAK